MDLRAAKRPHRGLARAGRRGHPARQGGLPRRRPPARGRRLADDETGGRPPTYGPGSASLAPDGVEWALAVANRNFIIHQYDEINRELTWLTLSRDLPAWTSCNCCSRKPRPRSRTTPTDDACHVGSHAPTHGMTLLQLSCKAQHWGLPLVGLLSKYESADSGYSLLASAADSWGGDCHLPHCTQQLPDVRPNSAPAPGASGSAHRRRLADGHRQPSSSNSVGAVAGCRGESHRGSTHP